MNLIFLGAPGAGKGTQAEVSLRKARYTPLLSTGNMLRDSCKERHTRTVLQRQGVYGQQAILYPDEVVIGILKDRIAQDDAKNGFILDGFPRTVAQAEALDAMGVQIDKVIEIAVPDEKIISRLSGRRVCEGCGASYHADFQAYKGRRRSAIFAAADVVQRMDDEPANSNRKTENIL